MVIDNGKLPIDPKELIKARQAQHISNSKLIPQALVRNSMGGIGVRPIHAQRLFGESLLAIVHPNQQEDGVISEVRVKKRGILDHTDQNWMDKESLLKLRVNKGG